MKSHEIIAAACAENGVKHVARCLHVSAALVYKWCEPTPTPGEPEASGALNPLDRVAGLFAATRDERLIRYLCNAAGGFYVANAIAEYELTILDGRHYVNNELVAVHCNHDGKRLVIADAAPVKCIVRGILDVIAGRAGPAGGEGERRRAA